MEDIQKFIESESNLSYEELLQINQALDNLEWLNIIGKISNEEYKKQNASKNEKPSKHIINFGKEVKKFATALHYIFGKDEAKRMVIHELKHAEVCEEYNVGYFFGIMKLKDIKGKKAIQAFILPSYEETMLLKPRDRILFNIKLNEAPGEDMSDGDKETAVFWRDKLKEFDSKNTSQ